MSQNGKNVKFEESHIRAICMKGEGYWTVCFCNEIKKNIFMNRFLSFALLNYSNIGS